MADTHLVRIDCQGLSGHRAKIWLDGQELLGVVAAKFQVSMAKPPQLTLTLYADVEIEGDAAIVQEWRKALAEA